MLALACSSLQVSFLNLIYIYIYMHITASFFLHRIVVNIPGGTDASKGAFSRVPITYLIDHQYIN